MRFVGLFGHVGGLSAVGALESDPRVHLPTDGEHWDAPFYCLVRAMGRQAVSGLFYVKLAGDTPDLEIAVRSGRVTRFHQVGRGNNDISFEVLRKQRPVSDIVLERAYEVVQEENKDLTRYLLESKKIQPREAVEAIREVKLRLLGRALEGRQGAFRFRQSAEVNVPRSPVEVPIDGLAARWLRSYLQQFEESELSKPLQPFLEKYPVMTEPRVAWMRRWGWDEREKTVLKTLDGRLTFERALNPSGYSRKRAARLLLAALALGFVDFADGRVQELAEQERPADELRKLIATVSHQEPFERLGLDWRCHPDDVRNAIAELREQYGGASPVGSTPAFVRLRRDLLKLYNDAFDELATAELRRLYRHGRWGAEQVVDQAKFLGVQARAKFQGGELHESKRLLEMVLDFGEADQKLLAFYEEVKASIPEEPPPQEPDEAAVEPTVEAAADAVETEPQA